MAGTKARAKAKARTRAKLSSPIPSPIPPRRPRNPSLGPCQQAEAWLGLAATYAGDGAIFTALGLIRDVQQMLNDEVKRTGRGLGV